MEANGRYLQDTAKEAIDMAINAKWDIEMEYGVDERFFVLSRGSKKIFLYEDWASFDSLFSSKNLYGNFGEQFMKVKARLETYITDKELKKNEEKEKWIRKVFCESR